MNDITSVYEYCVNPLYNVNYFKWCNNAYTGNKLKNDGKKI